MFDLIRDIFSTPEMRGVFSDETRTGFYLEIEAALARVQGRLGIIPPEAVKEIVSKCRIQHIDFDKLKVQTERIGYPILGVVQQIVERCERDLGEWCHWGATTQDITDTATVMQIRAALDLVEADMEAIAATPGLDGLLVGPADLALSMGLDFSMMMSERVLDAIEKVAATCKKHGLIAASVGFGRDNVEEQLRRGVDFITAGADSLFLRQGAAQEVEALKKLREARS